MNTVIFAAHPISTGLLVFSLLFFIPTIRLVIQLTVDSSTLQWLVTIIMTAVNTGLFALALSFLTD